ncbi:hypothetical protein ACHAW5_009007 [Stephanodiscus triporus]|uniref:Secreted protein n=1 Tax=Stephanodiscus triporus TaxID=2934178 RepID=A0ABD3PIM3_9STRA
MLTAMTVAKLIILKFPASAASAMQKSQPMSVVVVPSSAQHLPAMSHMSDGREQCGHLIARRLDLIARAPVTDRQPGLELEARQQGANADAPPKATIGAARERSVVEKNLRDMVKLNNPSLAHIMLMTSLCSSRA